MGRRFIPQQIDRVVNDRFNEWAEWKMRRIDGGPQGYGEPGFAKFALLGGRVSNMMPVDLSERVCNRAEVESVNRLFASFNEDLQMIVVGLWVAQRTPNYIARTLQVAPQTIRNRIASVNGAAMAWFTAENELSDVLRVGYIVQNLVEVSASKAG